ncbi:hypothetical protein JX265_010912 [Neoarthrinium moseri]|uniref:DUF6699 domain-containing protein n=1 Tax=Neoarthrinium moseri TaxID=1658444 RepID=A0A9P9WDE7_9PEZI|nr:uncharacterized protein JN550_008976 [Neoarthrinium moseri]KAI1846328.1 hypothetical protein JX266_007533 [Neoarthrinium moseri]KAI1858244.1 hypothetical protein JX265_010912 [Neoarthrinium moseri]KAI1864419.1 hypothetical protein JN550_008976 [Neoarthrinium moseri]
MSEPLSKVDSAVEGLSSSPPKKEGRRASSLAAGVMNIEDLRDNKTSIEVAIETQKTGWKINSSSSTVEDKDILKKHLTTPPVKKIDLEFPTGVTVTARSLKGVTIKDTLDAIHKQFKKRADDELPEPYLKGFAWDGLRPGNTEEDTKNEWTRLHVHLTTTPTTGGGGGGGKKKKNKGGDE